MVEYSAPVLRGNEGPEMVCSRCTRHFWPRCGAYWFLLLAPRGRCRFPHATRGRAVLCSECGRELREYLEANAYTPDPAYDNVGEDWKGEPYEEAEEGQEAGPG